MTNKEKFNNFLEVNFPDRAKELQAKFQLYYDVLVEANSKINLFSRKMPLDDIWTVHFLDSVLPYKLLKSANPQKSKRVLDFGTGGGIPGIPIALLYPNYQINLLDSKRKKLMVIEEMIDILGLDNVGTIWSRIEEYHTINSYDYIISRSVRILPTFKKPLFSLLDKRGKIILYKSKVLDDINQFRNYKIHDYSSEELGTRNVIEVMGE